MDLLAIVLTVSGLVLFEIVSSIDNAIINAEVLVKVSRRARKWFLYWGMLISVFLLRGLLPWLLVYLLNPALGPIGALTASLKTNPGLTESIEHSSHVLLAGGGIFLIFLFFHWLFLENKEYGLKGERFFYSQGVWFYAVISVILSIVAWISLKVDPILAFGAILGSTAFFIVHGFKEKAEESETSLKDIKSDLATIFYLEVIDATFSIDGVVGSFAYTLSVPLILLGNGIGALVVRQLTIGNIDRIKNYIFLKNGAMYSMFLLGFIMLLDSFGLSVPTWLSPIVTAFIVGYFFIISKERLNESK